MEEPGNFWEHPATKADAVGGVTKLLTVSGGVIDDAVALRSLGDRVDGTCRCLRAWVEAAAAEVAPCERRAFSPELLGSCCRFMEALATARSALFSAECRALARPVATVLQHAMPVSATCCIQGLLPATGTPDEGAGSPRGGNEDAAAVDGIQGRKTLELWVDMLGISLLPFCGGSDDSRRRHRPRSRGATEGDKADDSDVDSDGDSSDEEDGGGASADARARSGWVGGWLRGTGAIGTEPPECPFDFSDNGADQSLPCRLAVFIAFRAKAAADDSRPASVSSLATVLAVLCAFTATEGHLYDSHGAVVGTALSSLMGIAEAVPESSAQAECVKAALVALKECAEAARPSSLVNYMPYALSLLESVPSRLKGLVIRSKGQGPKAYSTARSFCSEALSAAVDCGRQLLRREGAAAVIAEKPRWFLDSFVVAMASPLLLGDAVGALRAASAASVEGAGGEEEEEDVAGALRDVVLPGAVDRLTKALASIDRYSAAAAAEVLKATSWLTKAAEEDMLPYRNEMGMAVVKCANGTGKATKASIGQDEKLRLCLRAIRRLCAVTSAGNGAAAEMPHPPTRPFAEAAFDLACGVVEREWLAKITAETSDRQDVGGVGPGGAVGGDATQGIMTVVQAHVTLAALLRSDMRLPGVDSSDGEWPLQAKRLAKLAWAFAYRVRKAGGAAGASCLADDDVMVLCQGAEVLGAAMECADDFFEGSVKLSFFGGELSRVLLAIRSSRDENTMHPVVLDACSWV